MKALLNGVPIITGPRRSKGLLTNNQSQVTKHSNINSNLVTSTSTNTVFKIIALYHPTMFSTTIYAWLRAIDAGHIST